MPVFSIGFSMISVKEEEIPPTPPESWSVAWSVAEYLASEKVVRRELLRLLNVWRDSEQEPLPDIL